MLQPTGAPGMALRDFFLRMEWFRPLPTARFPDEVLTASPGGIPTYYAGNLGTIVSIAMVFRGIRNGSCRDHHQGLQRRLQRALAAVDGTGPSEDLTLRPARPMLQYLQAQPHYRTRHRRVMVALASGRSIRRGAHVLVLVAWLGPPGTGDVDADYWMDGCHLDGNPANNRLRNLIWGDRRMNAAQREEHRRARLTQAAEQVSLRFGGFEDAQVDLDVERERREALGRLDAPGDDSDIPF